jgi:hypothetical protein
MSAVLLAVFKGHEGADRARMQLVFDGFPTDRVDVTSSSEPGRAGLEPGESMHQKLANYFDVVCAGGDGCAERLARLIDDGAATVTVHPRGGIEVERALRILTTAGATEFVDHDLENQTWEHAAARHDSPWVGHFWLHDPANEYHCIYCRLFEKRAQLQSEVAS